MPTLADGIRTRRQENVTASREEATARAVQEAARVTQLVSDHVREIKAELPNIASELSEPPETWVEVAYLMRDGVDVDSMYARGEEVPSREVLYDEDLADECVGDLDECNIERDMPFIRNPEQYLHAQYRELLTYIREQGLEPTIHMEMGQITHSVAQLDDYGEVVSGGSWSPCIHVILGIKLPSTTTQSK